MHRAFDREGADKKPTTADNTYTGNGGNKRDYMDWDQIGWFIDTRGSET